MLAITGITGHTGKYFADELKKARYDGSIKCLVRSSTKAAFLTESGLDAEIICGNLQNDDDIRALLSGADTVVHIANIRFSANILRIGRECGVKRFILVHTTGIYSKYRSAAEEYIEIESKILPLMEECGITILRPTMIFGDMCDRNISKFIRFVHRLPILPVVGRGKSLINPVNARDLAQAVYKALVSHNTLGKAYDISGGDALTMRALYIKIANFLGKKRLILSVPMGLCLFCARLIRLVTRGKTDIIEKIQRMGEDRSFSCEAAKEDFGYSPEPFDIGLHREIDQYLLTK